ncbi:MAG: FAD-binding protein [Bacteroidales bacterium]|jgi:electron transfer flavoprotein alpha subunit
MSPKPKKKPRGKVRLIEGKCISCGARCQTSCSVDAIEINELGEPVFDIEKCFGCRKCIKVCPSDAIEVFYTPEEENILKEYETKTNEQPENSETEKSLVEGSNETNEWKGVWIFVEQVSGNAHDVSWELLGKGRELASNLNVELSAFVIGENIKHLAKEAFCYGADKVYVTDNPVLKYYRTKAYVDATVNLINKYKPEIVLMGATGLGRDLAGAVATKLKTGLTADCTALAIDKKKRLLEQTRPAFGGNIMATILTEIKRPQMASVRPHVMPKPEYIIERKGEFIEELFSMSEADISTKVLEIISLVQNDNVNISAANILVSGGRGMRSKENFKLLEEFAENIGGVVSGSRCAIDSGWLEHSRQVGQTGKTVHPKLYIACGISGAIQHLVGMQDSEYIIAINKDKSAPIFSVANLGIVGDLFEVIPELIKKIKQSDTKIVH